MNTQYGRDDGIWTHNLYVPNVALYQIEPHLVIKFLFSVCGMLCGHFVFLKYFSKFLKWCNPKCIKACSIFWVLVEPWELRFPERSALPNWATSRNSYLILNRSFLREKTYPESCALKTEPHPDWCTMYYTLLNE